MANLSSILCPVDMSDCSRAALDYALFLAKATEARVHVLNVWEIPVIVRPDLVVWTESTASGTSLADLVKLRAQAALEHFLAPLDAASRALVTTHLAPGSAALVIVGLAAEHAHDLIVMGTHGRSGLSRWVLGSVSERVVRHAACPVLTIHAQSKSDSARSTSM